MRKLTTYIKENKIIIQQADYIEDGWYIEIVDNIITLYEIPLHGGKESKKGNYETVIKAINAGYKLT